MELQPIDSCNVVVLVDNVTDILSTTPSSVTGHIPNVLKAYGVMGGFHLSGEECEAIIPETIEDMKSFDLKVIVPGHCTGWRAVHKLVEAFGDETVIMSAVGNTHRF